MKIWLLLKDYGYDGGLSPKGLYASADAARDGAREHAVEYCSPPKPDPATVRLEWNAAKLMDLDIGEPYQAASPDGYSFEIQEFELTADAAVLLAAAEVIGRRFPANEAARKLLGKMAGWTEPEAEK